MIPVAFDYAAPATVEDALSALAAGGDDAKLLGGGQSLLPVLRLRLAAPDILVDLNKVASMRGVRADGDDLVIGAMTTHHEVAVDPLVRNHAHVLAQAATSVGDPQIRYRGTIGGALAHADPAGDVGAPVLALDAVIEITGATGSRTVSAGEFFVDYFTTDLADDEILTAVRFPKRTGWAMNYQKFSQVAQSWSIVGVAAAVKVEGTMIADARIGLTNMGSTPLRATAVESALRGGETDIASVKAACASAGDGTNPPNDAGGSADYRRHLAGVLTARAVTAAIS